MKGTSGSKVGAFMLQVRAGIKRLFALDSGIIRLVWAWVYRILRVKLPCIFLRLLVDQYLLQVEHLFVNIAMSPKKLLNKGVVTFDYFIVDNFGLS